MCAASTQVLCLCLLVCPLALSLTLRCAEEGATKRDPSKCHAYYKCNRGVLVSKTCKNGYFYDVFAGRCEIDDGQCRTKACREGFIEPDADNCANYLQCVNGEIVRQTCARGSYFDYAWQVCIVDVKGICPMQAAVCKQGELKEDDKDAEGYLQCINGKFVSQKCSDGSYYDARLKTCVVDKDDEACVEGLLEQDDEDCTRYWTCVTGELVSESCEDGSYFDPTFKMCLDDPYGISCNETFE